MEENPFLHKTRSSERNKNDIFRLVDDRTFLFFKFAPNVDWGDWRYYFIPILEIMTRKRLRNDCLLFSFIDRYQASIEYFCKIYGVPSWIIIPWWISLITRHSVNVEMWITRRRTITRKPPPSHDELYTVRRQVRELFGEEWGRGEEAVWFRSIRWNAKGFRRRCQHDDAARKKCVCTDNSRRKKKEIGRDEFG